MGFPKPLLPYQGTTFLEHLVAVLHGQVQPLIVVLGAQAPRIRASVALPPDVLVVENKDWSDGQLSSLKTGLRILDAEAALVALVDHPCVDRALVAQLIAAYSPPLLIPTYNGRRGHPMIFGRELFAELLDAPLDQGARPVVRRHQALELPVSGEGILHDLDDPETYRRVTGLEVPA